MKKSQEYSREVSSMANPFLNKTDLMDRDIETAIMLEQAIVHNIGKAVAYTDGKQVYVNTDDNLFNILPAYDHRMLKWLLWHERYHMELRHHNRYFKYLSELSEEEVPGVRVTKEEVNIIMDILVHDSLSKMFPDLVEVATNNLAQFRNRNSLGYTFKTFTLEEMLDEYKASKTPEDTDDTKGKGEKSEDGDGEETETAEDKKGHGEGGEPTPSDSKDRPEDGEPEDKDESERPDEGESLPDEHSKTDWSKLDNVDSKEFITKEESEQIQDAVNRLKRKKFRLAKITETLNGLVTSTRMRTYTKPSPIKVGGGVILKGSTPGRTQLYLIFDASGSMSSEMQTFKEIISKSIPQAMDMPCEWFAGYNYDSPIKPYKTEHCDGYYKAKFRDFMPVRASSGYDDDGDRTIELCWQAEQLGYSPIGVTDGGGQLSWSKDKLKQLKRTVLVGQNSYWLDLVKKVNPRIQTLDI